MLLPKKAKRVFQGILFDVYQWPQKMFDGTTAVFEAIRRRSSVDVIAVLDDGNILTIQQEQPAREPYPAIPGGQIEPDETPKAAAARELLEETGYTARELVHFKTYNDQSKIDFPSHLFIARGCAKVQKQHLDSGEKIALAPVAFDAFLALARNPLFAISPGFRLELFEALLDVKKKNGLKKKIFE